MYFDHFGLKENPFGLTPDTGFLYGASAHQDALATLALAVRGGEGFVKLTGEVGTGKTLLCRALLQSLQADCVTAYIPNPRLTPRELFRTLADEFALSIHRRSASHDFYQSIERALFEFAEQGRAVVLCVDEAQAMPVETLEALRLLSNIETRKAKLLQIVLFGQPELDAVLAQPDCRSLASRIAFAAQLRPLDAHEFRHYLQHRMVVAGWRGPEVFTPLARWLMRRGSGGVPRRANVLAHKGLMLAYGDGQHRVGWRHAWTAWRDSRLHAPSTGHAHRSTLSAGARS